MTKCLADAYMEVEPSASCRKEGSVKRAMASGDVMFAVTKIDAKIT